ncbi:MAG: hypothetical protein GQ574_10250 [Crocinitomix sp.]|nr:hypothetical protein [Crocinitomix sp.]
MKRVYLVGVAATVFLLGSCVDRSSDLADALGDIDMSEILTDDAGTDEIHDAAAGFAEGLSSTGQGYFSGLLAEVIEVDVKFKEVERMDDMDAEAEKIEETLDATLEKIDEARTAIDLYEDKTWPKRAEFHTLSVEWFDAVEDLVNDYLFDLTDQMSRPEEDWSDDEWTAYEDYLVALDSYYEVDQRWVEFQYVYAEANDFEIGGTIDEEAMVDEAISEDGVE